MPNILNMLIDLYMWVIMLRLILQYMEVDYNNPLSQWSLKLTQPVTDQISRFVSKQGSIDYPSIIWLVVVSIIGVFVFSLLHQIIPNIVVILFSIIFGILSQLCFLYFVLLLVMSIASWFSSQQSNPALGAVRTVLKPVLQPIQNVVPPIAGLDFSPAIAAIIFLIVGSLASSFALAI